MKALVIGGGLAGSCAALELREAGAEVVLCHIGAGATAACGGPIDITPAGTLVGEVAPVVAGRLETPATRLESCRQRFPRHPYTTLFASLSPEQVRGQVALAVERLNEWLSPLSLRIEGSLERPALFAGVDGSLRAGDFALSSVAAGNLATASGAAWVAFPGLASWQPSLAALTLRDSLRTLGRDDASVSIVEPEWPAHWCEVAKDPARLAALLDDTDQAETFLDALRPFLRPDRLLLIPPLLGLDAGKGTSSRIGEATGHRVAEVVASAPESSVGFRFDRALRAAVASAGVEVCGTAVASLVADSPVERLRKAHFASGECESFDVFVLATGRFSSGGLTLRDDCVAEALLDLPLFDAAGRRVDGRRARQQTRPGYHEAQPLYSSGIRIDASCRPLDAEGHPPFSNLFAAGDLVGGFDPARDRTGYGVALLTGLSAGRGAAGRQRDGA